MPTLLLSAVVEYGRYVSLPKFIIFALMFFAWLPLVNWVYTDSQAVKTKVKFWTGTLAATGAGTLVIWLVAPLFIIGLMLYLIAVGATAMSYIMHRNSRVSDFERVLTAEHLKSIFVDEEKKLIKVSRGLSFITANGNEVPMPRPKSHDAFGFTTAAEVLDDAIWRRASDVIFRPGNQDYDITYRIDGIAVKQDPRTKDEIEYFTNYLKKLADLDTEERRKPQTGTFTVVKEKNRIAWEVKTAGSTAGEQLRLKRPQEHLAMKINDLGLNTDQLKPLQNISKMQKGLIIISGPKKSGVTSTFYAMLRNHDPFMNIINTLEKQPAMQLDNITQNTFSMSDTGTTTYAKKLQSMLRMGVEIIGVADCDDAKSVALACAAAKNGKLVYVTIEATSVIQALGRWIKLAPDREIVANNMVAIINQRLARKLCTECKQAYQPNPELLRKFNIPADAIKVLYRPAEIEYDKHGKPLLCEKCQGTGFVGRTGIFETIVLNDELRNAVKQAKSLQEIISRFRGAGMLYLQDQAIRKVAKGITSINEVVRELSATQKIKKQTKK